MIAGIMGILQHQRGGIAENAGIVDDHLGWVTSIVEKMYYDGTNIGHHNFWSTHRLKVTAFS